MTLALGLLVSLMGCAWLCALAHGEVLARIAHVPLAGPVLAGGLAEWADGRPDGGFSLDASAPGLRARVLQQFDPQDPLHALGPDMAGSADRVALEVPSFFLSRGEGDMSGVTSFQSFSGKPAAVTAPLTPRCDGRNPGLLLRAVSVSSDEVAYQFPNCTTTPAVTNFAASPPSTSSFPDDAARRNAVVLGARVAGPYAAFFEELPVAPGATTGQDDLVVYDVRSQTDVYRIAVGSLPGQPPQGGAAVFPVDLKVDGSVAFVYGISTSARVGWASRAQPYAHVVPLPRAGHWAVRWAGTNLLLLRAPQDQGRLANGTLELSDLRGHIRKVVARGVYDQHLIERFDTDGRRVAYITRDCRGARIVAQSLSAPTRNNPVIRRCHLALTQRPSLIHHGPNRVDLRLRVSCLGLVGRCAVGSGRATLTGPAGRQGLLAARGVGDLAFHPLDLHLNRTARRLLAHDHRLRLHVTVNVGDPSSPDSADTAAEEARSADLTIRG